MSVHEEALCSVLMDHSAWRTLSKKRRFPVEVLSTAIQGDDLRVFLWALRGGELLLGEWLRAHMVAQIFGCRQVVQEAALNTLKFSSAENLAAALVAEDPSAFMGAYMVIVSR